MEFSFLIFAALIMLRSGNICNFNRLFSFDSSLLNFSSNFTKLVTVQSPFLSCCKRMIFVDYIMNALKHSRVRLTFFIRPVCWTSFGQLKRRIGFAARESNVLFPDDAIWPRSIFSFMSYIKCRSVQCIITVSLIY